MRRRRQQADRGSRSFTSVAGPPRTLPRIGVLCNLQMRPTLLLPLLATLAAAPAGIASDRVGLNASNVRLAVSGDGKRALITYRAQGRTRHVLAWGAVNALSPNPAVPQVRFRFDWTGGWESLGHTIWQSFGHTCGPYDGPALAGLVAACKGSDGSYWALQSWQPNLPHRGFPPYRARQTDWELDVSHWTGPIAELEL